MQLISAFSAAALLYTTVLADTPNIAKRNPWFRHNHRHHAQQSTDLNSTSTPSPTSIPLTCPTDIITSTITITASITSTVSIPISNSTTVPWTNYITSSSTSTSSSSLMTSIPVTASPVLTATGSVLHPSTTVTPTMVVSAGQATGTPNPGALHCGVHGYPNGDYFLALYDFEKADEAVTLLGCYEECIGSYGANMSCQSYRFYPEPRTGAPRCSLYGGSVADSLQSVIPYVPDVWYDLRCGNPVV